MAGATDALAPRGNSHSSFRNGAFHAPASAMLYVRSHPPLVTPNGVPGNVGVVVATPALTVAEAAQQWMCEAVEVPVKPPNVALTRISWVAAFNVMMAKPVPLVVTGGFSAPPVKVAL